MITKEQLEQIAKASGADVEFIMHYETEDGCISMRRERINGGNWEYSVERHFEPAGWDKKSWQDMPCDFNSLQVLPDAAAAVAAYMGAIANVQSVN